MPKRTNAFQKLVLMIYEQMAVPGASVEESVLLKERGSAVEREVDILLTRRVFGTELRIAVECRGRKAKDDITWIDGLIGKYENLDVHKIAVSQSGFTPAAAEKAASNRIDTLSLQQALETDWPAQFIRLGMGVWTRTDEPLSIHVAADPPLPSGLPLDTPIVDSMGEAIATVEQVARSIYEKSVGDVSRAIADKFLTFFKTVADLNTKKVVVELGTRPPIQAFILGEGGTQHRVESFTLKVQCTFSGEPVSVEHYLLGEAQVSTARLESGQDAVSVTTIQVSDKPNEARVHIAPVSRKGRRP